MLPFVVKERLPKISWSHGQKSTMYNHNHLRWLCIWTLTTMLLCYALRMRAEQSVHLRRAGNVATPRAAPRGPGSCRSTKPGFATVKPRRPASTAVAMATVAESGELTTTDRAIEQRHWRRRPELRLWHSGITDRKVAKFVSFNALAIVRHFERFIRCQQRSTSAGRGSA